MKLVIAIVQDKDSHKLMNKLTEDGYSFTRLSTTGGFLRAGNTTLLIGVDQDQVDQIIDVISQECKTRNHYITSTKPLDSSSREHYSKPTEVSVGGATIFVVDINKFEKL